MKPLPNAGIDPLGDVVIFSYETGKFDALPTGAGYTYVWKRNGNAIPGATSSSYSTTTPGDYSVDVTYDGCTKASPTATLIVNSKPVATIQPAANVVLPASSTTIYGSGSDSDGTIVAYHWTQQSGPFAAQLANENTNTLSVSNLAGGTYVFRLTVTDNVGEEAYDEVTVNVVYPPNNHNWIRETVVAVPGQENEGDVNGLDIGEKQVTWTYFDGLGRTSQKILVNGSPEGYDIVEPLKYDQHGREVYKFLPYVSSENNGFFKPGATGTTTYAGSPHAIFYNNGSSDKAIDDAAPFSKTIFERSPLNRVLEQGAPGITWQPDGTDSYTSADRTVKFAYEINGATDVLKWVYVPPTTGAPMGLVSAKLSGSLVYYAANQLERTKTKDENRNEVIEYKDIEGRVVLKQVEDADEFDSVYYNGITTIKRKTQLAMTEGLSGVMIWEIGQDTRDDRSLLKAINEEVGDRQ